jgi:hypothetical protein
MHKKLILKAFDKADATRKKQGDKRPSLINKAEDLADYVVQEMGFSLGERSYRDYRREAEELKNSEKDINIKQHKVVLGLLRYLEYDNYEGFKKENDFQIEEKTIEEKISNKKLTFFSKHKAKLMVMGIIIIGFVLFKSFNTQRWMSWNVNQYIEVNFDTEKYEIGQLKLYSQDRITNFRKITPNCDSDFFKESGEANLWYGKNESGVIEYFTSIGKHPKTGKTLKEITGYMVKKHICSAY